MGIEYSAKENKTLTWSLNNGYANVLLRNNYPQNEVGGILDEPYVFTLNQSNSNGNVCGFYNGFQV